MVGTATIKEEVGYPPEHALFKGESCEVLAPTWPRPHTTVKAPRQTDTIHWLREPISIWSGDLCVLTFFFQHIILYYFKKGKNITEIQKKICAVYGEGAVNELVYEAIVMVLESTGESTFKMILDLLKSLWKSSTITVDQMKRVSVTLFWTILRLRP